MIFIFGIFELYMENVYTYTYMYINLFVCTILVFPLSQIIIEVLRKFFNKPRDFALLTRHGKIEVKFRL